MRKISAALVSCFFSVGAQAAGFALIEQSASGLGNAFAGAAASAEDASTIFFNPAGMIYIQGNQVVGALHLINPNAYFNDDDSTGGTLRTKGGEGGDLGDLAFVPNFYYVHDVSEGFKAGVGINAPFGLKTEYDDDWMGRFHAVKSELKTVNINPSIAFKPTDNLSLGFGVSAMWAQAELTRAVNYVTRGEGSVKIKGDDWGFGFNAGAILQVTDATRVGLAYRSKVNQHLDGDVKFQRPDTGIPAVNAALAAATPNGDVTADLTLPETLSLSVFSQVNDAWDVMADVTWTHWSRFQELKVMRDSGAVLTNVEENWHNTMRYSIGANYKYSDSLKLRVGVAYDEEAIPTDTRTARIPGNDRTWVALGAAWQVNPNTKLDIGYAHLFIRDAKIDDNQTSTFNGRLKGEYDGSVDILSAQVTYSF